MDENIWQKDEYFGSFEEFDPTAAYVPQVVVDNLARLDLATEIEIDGECVGGVYAVLYAILRACFRPLDRHAGPEGFVEGFDEEEIATLTSLPVKVVSQHVKYLRNQNVVAQRGKRVWIRHPRDWQADINIKPRGGSATELTESNLRRLFNLLAPPKQAGHQEPQVVGDAE